MPLWADATEWIEVTLMDYFLALIVQVTVISCFSIAEILLKGPENPVCEKKKISSRNTTHRMVVRKQIWMQISILTLYFCLFSDGYWYGLVRS